MKINKILSDIQNITEIMYNQYGIEDLECLSSGTDFPLHWIAPVSNDDYDYHANPLDLDEDYEKSGSSPFFMCSIQNSIKINKNKEGYTIEDGVEYVESHSYCTGIKKDTPGSLPWYVKYKFKDLQSLINQIEELYTLDEDFLEQWEDGSYNI